MRATARSRAAARRQIDVECGARARVDFSVMALHASPRCRGRGGCIPDGKTANERMLFKRAFFTAQMR
jgi:hypothetical protein